MYDIGKIYKKKAVPRDRLSFIGCQLNIYLIPICICQRDRMLMSSLNDVVYGVCDAAT